MVNVHIIPMLRFLRFCHDAQEMTTRGQISFVSRSIYDASPVTLSLRAHLYITPEEGVFHLVDLHCP